MSRTIFFHGMMRSGNHVVIDWIRTGRPGTIHLNDAFPVRRELVKPGVHKFPRNYHVFLARTLEPRQLIPAFGGRLLVSFEDYPLDHRFFRNPPRAQQVLIVRSARNVFASRIRRAFQVTKPAFPRVLDDRMRRAMAAWVDHSRALREREQGHDFVGIAFDRWVADAAYRRSVAARLGFEDRHGLSAQRPHHGGGSSFDGTALVGSGDLDSLTRRAEQLAEEERELLDAVLADPELGAEAQRFDSAFATSST